MMHFILGGLVLAVAFLLLSITLYKKSCAGHNCIEKEDENND